jgi:GTP cyclohydrolase FolE2
MCESVLSLGDSYYVQPVRNVTIVSKRMEGHRPSMKSSYDGKPRLAVPPRDRRRKGVSAIAGVLLIGVLVILGTASLAVYLTPGMSGTHPSVNTALVTSTITSQVTSYVTSTLQLTSYTTLTTQLTTTTTGTVLATSTLVSTSTTVTTSTSITISVTTNYRVFNTTITQTVTQTA